ncbi:MAG: FAD-binding oxidoreductase [Paraburkholderia sp.]
MTEHASQPASQTASGAGSSTGSIAQSSAAFIAACRNTIGAAHVLTASHDTAPYLTDWRHRYAGAACAVLCPSTPAEVAALVKLAVEYRIALVPQGGNTGLAGGATPDASGAQAVLSLRRLNRVRDIDPHNNTITVEAGVILADVQARAEEAGRLFPLSLAAEGSCTIGGNLATNAGGTGVLRYGNTRELCLGLEVVTPQGELWDGLRGLRKDNTGYDLRDLFIGAEGTLGIITGAVLKLHPQPAARVTALAALASPHAALDFLVLTQRFAGPLLTGFELMSDFCLRLVGRHFPQLRYPFAEPHGQVVLLELSDSESEEHGRALFERLMETALDDGLVEDAVVAENLAQSQAFWNLREHISLAQAEEGLNIKHDIAVPISRIGHFIEATDAAIAQAVPGARMVTFGHLGDGNLHYNVQAPEGIDAKAFLAEFQSPINQIVYDSVHQHRGSISAEHGLGQLKVDEAMHYKTDVEVRLMRAVKRALDPLNLMNPGKVLRQEHEPGALKQECRK